MVMCKCSIIEIFEREGREKERTERENRKRGEIGKKWEREKQKEKERRERENNERKEKEKGIWNNEWKRGEIG